MGGFHHKCSSFGWGKTLAQGFKITIPQPGQNLFVFTQNNSNWKWKSCALLLMYGPRSGFLVVRTLFRGKCYWERKTAEMAGPPGKAPSYKLRSRLAPSHAAQSSIFYTKNFCLQHSSNLKCKTSELWQTPLNSELGEPFLSPFHLRCFPMHAL